MSDCRRCWTRSAVPVTNASGPSFATARSCMNTSTAPAICPGACRSNKRRGRIASASPTANAGLRGPMGHKPSSHLSSRRAKRYGEPGAARMAPWCSMRSRRPTNRLPSLVRGRATWRRWRCGTSISLGGDHPDPNYARRRRNMFIVAVNCSHPAQTCFCVSTGDGPRATFGFDIAMSELDNGFVAESGSERGAAILDGLHLPGATREQTATATIRAGMLPRCNTGRCQGETCRRVCLPIWSTPDGKTSLIAVCPAATAHPSAQPAFAIARQKCRSSTAKART